MCYLVCWGDGLCCFYFMSYSDVFLCGLEKNKGEGEQSQGQSDLFKWADREGQFHCKAWDSRAVLAVQRGNRRLEASRRGQYHLLDTAEKPQPLPGNYVRLYQARRPPFILPEYSIKRTLIRFPFSSFLSYIVFNHTYHRTFISLEYI